MALTSLVDQMKVIFVGFMDKANDHSNTVRQVVNEIQVLSSILSLIEGTKDAIISIKGKLEDHLKSLSLSEMQHLK